MEAELLKSRVSSVKSIDDFNDLAISIFNYQRKNNPVYCDFLTLINFKQTIIHFSQIPCLPISFFKSHQLYFNSEPAEIEFFSSSTSGSIPSKHPVHKIDYYLKNTEEIFKQFYGDPADCIILALLPGYLERKGSSLIAMMQFLIDKAQTPSGFFLNEKKELAATLQALKNSGKKVILVGVTFALIEFANEFPGDYSHITIMETGGMKGRGKELTREELHAKLKNAFQVKHIHSEYGMTELLSQAYSQKDGVFNCPPWLKFLTRNTNDPFEIYTTEKSGALNSYDLANVDSVSFIASDDLGTVFNDGSFEVLGRLDNSDIRGCNLLVL